MKINSFNGLVLIVLWIFISCQDSHVSKPYFSNAIVDSQSKSIRIENDSAAVHTEADCVFNNGMNGDTEKAIFNYDK